CETSYGCPTSTIDAARCFVTWTSATKTRKHETNELRVFVLSWLHSNERHGCTVAFDDRRPKPSCGDTCVIETDHRLPRRSRRSGRKGRELGRLAQRRRPCRSRPSLQRRRH